jgi:hypothetical protein
LIEYKGLEEIIKFLEDKSQTLRVTELSIRSIEKDADTAHIKYHITLQEVPYGELRRKFSAEMSKKGQAWKIKRVVNKPM